MNQTPQKIQWATLIGLSLLACIAFLDFTIVYTALPSIQVALHVPVLDLQWVMNVFTLVLAVFMIAAGRLGDVFGKRKVFFIGAIVFGIAAIGAGASTSFAMLIAFRTLQAFGAAILFTTGAALAPQVAPAEQQNKAIGIYSTITGLGLMLGPFLGGILVSALGWRWVFYVTIPFIIVGISMCAARLQETERVPNEKIDWLGVVLFAIGIGGLVYALIHGQSVAWNNSVTVTWFVIAAVALIVFFIAQNKVKQPLLNLHAIKKPKILLGIVACWGGATMCAILLFFPPLYLSVVLGLKPYQFGLVMLAPPIIQALTASQWGRLTKRFGAPNMVLAGFVICLISALMQACFGMGTGIVFILVALGCMGVLWGVANTAAVTFAFETVSGAEAGGVIGTIFTNWNVGNSIIIAIATIIFDGADKGMMSRLLASHNVSLTAQQHNQVAVMLSQPSAAHHVLSQMVGGIAARLQPLFQMSFLHAYHSAMVFAAILLVVGLLIAWPLAAKSKKGAETL